MFARCIFLKPPDNRLIGGLLLFISKIFNRFESLKVPL